MYVCVCLIPSPLANDHMSARCSELSTSLQFLSLTAGSWRSSRRRDRLDRLDPPPSIGFFSIKQQLATGRAGPPGLFRSRVGEKSPGR